MKLSLIALLTLTACDTDGLLGTEFYAGNHLQGVEVEASVPEAGAEASDEAGDDASPDAVGDSASPLADSGHDAGEHEAAIDTGTDAGVIGPDTGTGVDSGEMMEASAEAEAGPTCPGAAICEPTSHYPDSFCLVPHQGDGDGAWPTPAECNTCGTYTCACILAHSIYVADAGCTCAVVADTVSIVCP